ncbi:MAG: peptide-methionine (R)-S-oxide reductase MsrB [Achromobacter sp.]|jgi:peptide-methionine (R)-S-oxide reductase|uniref:peptide-methionine (R)-S-oxide reductase n=1 Tax=Achromobacter insuavis TaxID=1287735 RepID=A0A6J5AFX7_9BURK|nr:MULTISPECIES: peptide-methionine (R)-S-oxide reductase MsrB [Achromobacter]MBN9638228.1 peptide-methionine (R)-S-oxide reductase MsrB [Achromobacter sp.]MCG2602672.1 peptide-methionine (R)-S-oxide reductase MsrB [Achromobacter sp.]CAB3668169.1 Peptide methionine sulfoxide reductase MsrB [Achromobacter insuavis]CAB3912204.1 Peptide methionine sulfoxide reductase MsrB [Achromobacter insuavis]CUI99971.1 Peptide methionine sulfoxide reductase MsrB [Achromobacter sp. 2789STDY5608633]
MRLTRRHFLGAGGAFAAAAGLAPLLAGRGARAAQPRPAYPYTLTDAQWRAKLSAAQYDVLRREGTERPYTSPLNDEHRAGTFACAGCAQKLFASTTKFDSGTGWPSFWQPLEHAVDTLEDRSFGMTRTAVNCSNCGGHLGHVFDDGPRPTGLRYCMNGVAMSFTPQA